MASNRSVNGAIGEYLTLAELLKRGFEAYLANGTTQLGVVVLNSDPKYIQVKGLGSSNDSVKVSKGSVDKGKFDYMIIVKFESGDCNSVSLQNNFYILNLQEVKQMYGNKKSTEKNSFTITKGEYLSLDHRDKWCKIS